MKFPLVNFKKVLTFLILIQDTNQQSIYLIKYVCQNFSHFFGDVRLIFVGAGENAYYCDICVSTFPRQYSRIHQLIDQGVPAGRVADAWRMWQEGCQGQSSPE